MCRFELPYITTSAATSSLKFNMNTMVESPYSSFVRYRCLVTICLRMPFSLMYDHTSLVLYLWLYCIIATRGVSFVYAHVRAGFVTAVVTGLVILLRRAVSNHLAGMSPLCQTALYHTTLSKQHTNEVFDLFRDLYAGLLLSLCSSVYGFVRRDCIPQGVCG